MNKPKRELDLWKVREFNIRNKQPVTVIVFKVFSGSTPIELMRELFDDIYIRDNDLPYCLLDLKTRIDYENYQNGYFNPKEAIVFYKVEGSILPPRIQQDNVLWCLRKGIDSDLFKSARYDHVVRFGWSGRYIDKWDMGKAKKKLQVLEKFFPEIITCA